MNLLLITDAYPPEIRSSSNLMYELAQELKDRGHRVTVITTWPRYNVDNGANPNKYSEIDDEHGITVIRVKTLPHHNVNYLIRGVAQILMPLQFLIKIWWHRVISDWCIIYSPPLPLALVGIGLKFQGVHSILNLQDLFPQNAIDLGVLKQPFQIKFFQAIERISYRYSDIITVHSEGNKRVVLERYPEFKNKINIIHNWVNLDQHQIRKPLVDFRKEWNLEHQFIAIFAGVMGPSQYLELIIEIADHLKEKEELLFLLVGGGKEKVKLIQNASNKGLTGVQFKNFVSMEVYPDLLKICSFGLVCLSPRNQTPVVPGKILGYMAAGIPVVAFLHKESDGHAIIKDAGCGISADSANKEACIQVFKEFFKKKHNFKNMGNAGREYASKHFSRESCVSRIEALLKI